MTGKQKNGKAARTAGALGEYYCNKVLGLCEPDVEIKTMQKERGRFSVELTQIERQVNKIYVIVVYSRGTYRSKKGRRNWDKTIKQAMTANLEFVLINGYRLIELIREGRYKTRWVDHVRETGGRLVALFSLSDAKDGTTMRSWEATHFVYATKETIKELTNGN